MANSKTVLLYKGKGAGNILDLGGLTNLYELVNMKSKRNPAISKKIRNFSRPSSQMIASIKQKAKSLIDDFKDEKLKVATSIEYEQKAFNGSGGFKLVY